MRSEQEIRDKLRQVENDRTAIARDFELAGEMLALDVDLPLTSVTIGTLRWVLADVGSRPKVNR